MNSAELFDTEIKKTLLDFLIGGLTTVFLVLSLPYFLYGIMRKPIQYGAFVSGSCSTVDQCTNFGGTVGFGLFLDDFSLVEWFYIFYTFAIIMFLVGGAIGSLSQGKILPTVSLIIIVISLISASVCTIITLVEWIPKYNTVNSGVNPANSLFFCCISEYALNPKNKCINGASNQPIGNPFKPCVVTINKHDLGMNTIFTYELILLIIMLVLSVTTLILVILKNSYKNNIKKEDLSKF